MDLTGKRTYTVSSVGNNGSQSIEIKEIHNGSSSIRYQVSRLFHILRIFTWQMLSH